MRAVVALAGQPNSGKTTLFNALTGSNAKVGNYPGITVERREAAWRLPTGREAVLLDIPGAYSLSARTQEEQIAITAIAGLNPHSEPDAVVVVVDATQLARNLYLLLQVLELRLKVVVALNMDDVVRKARLRLDAEALSAELGGVPVVRISASRGEGLPALAIAVEQVLSSPGATAVRGPEVLDGTLAEDLGAVESAVPAGWSRGDPRRRRALAAWALMSIDEGDELWEVPADLRQAVRARQIAAATAGRDIDLELAGARWRWIDARMPRLLAEVPTTLRRVTDAVDRVLIHPAFGFLIFLLLMALVFEALFSWSQPAIDAIDGAVGALATGLRVALPAGLLTDFLTDGLVAGFGAVVVFLPQILLLFLFISIMEDSGYMARAAFLMDRIMKAIGLTGRAFVPMLSGYACAIPAIMATRTMERQRDRLLTMMVVPIMTCSARLPVYTLIIGALFPGPDEPGGRWGPFAVQAGFMVGLYLFSTVMALAAAAVLGRTLFKGKSAPLLLELPPYRMPSPRSVLRLMWERSRLFVSEAGTVILGCTIVLWLLLSFPRGEPGTPPHERLQQSYGGHIGRLIEPAIEPLGFDWKIGIGLVGAFAAREVFVSTMGVVYGVGDEVDEESLPLREKLHAERWPDGRRVYTPLVGLSLMVFFALAAQCMSTLAVVRRETKTWRWPVFLFAYMTVLAWVCSFAVYQIGTALGF